MVKIQMNKKMSNSLYNNVEISNAVERSVNDLLKRKNDIYHLHILFYMQGSSLLIRSECLLLFIIIIIILLVLLLLLLG